jgi:hypothetical protein
MPDKYKIINILTYKLPYDLAKQVYNEYQDRYKEMDFIIKNSRKYNILERNIGTVEALLALSVFHKRVISNLDAAVKFHKRVTNASDAKSIRIGSYEFTGEEKNRVLSVVISFNQLLSKFKIHPILFDYHLTKDFLDKVRFFKSSLRNGNRRS